MKLLHSLFFAWVFSVKGQFQTMKTTRKTYGPTTDREVYNSALGMLPVATTLGGIALVGIVAGGATGVTRRTRRERLA